MDPTSKITRQSPHPNPPLKRGLRLPYSADGMGEGTGCAVPRATLFRPKAFRLISIEALGRSARCIFVLRGFRVRT